MKTIYVLREDSGIDRIVIEDNTLSQVEEAIKEVNLHSEKGASIMSIDINVAYLEKHEDPHKIRGRHAIIRVSKKIEEYGEGAPAIREYDGKMPAGRVYANLVVHGAKGLEGVINGKDLLELPDSYFSAKLVWAVTWPLRDTVPLLMTIDEKHGGEFAQAINRGARRRLAEYGSTHGMEKERTYWNVLIEQTDSFLNKTQSFVGLIEDISSCMKEYSEQWKRLKKEADAKKPGIL